MYALSALEQTASGQSDLVIGMLSKGQAYPPYLPAAVCREVQSWHLVSALSNSLTGHMVGRIYNLSGSGRAYLTSPEGAKVEHGGKVGLRRIETCEEEGVAVRKNSLC